MATRTVRLDDEAEAALREVRATTGLPISEVLKRGVRALRDQVSHDAGRTPYDVYRELDHGPSESATAPSRDAKEAVLAAIKTKLGR